MYTKKCVFRILKQNILQYWSFANTLFILFSRKCELIFHLKNIKKLYITLNMYYTYRSMNHKEIVYNTVITTIDLRTNKNNKNKRKI